MTISLMRWECEGLVAHGDCQEAMFNDYCQHFFSDAARRSESSLEDQA